VNKRKSVNGPTPSLCGPAPCQTDPRRHQSAWPTRAIPFTARALGAVRPRHRRRDPAAFVWTAAARGFQPHRGFSRPRALPTALGRPYPLIVEAKAVFAFLFSLLSATWSRPTLCSSRSAAPCSSRSRRWATGAIKRQGYGLEPCFNFPTRWPSSRRRASNAQSTRVAAASARRTPPSAACLRLLSARLPPPRGPLHHPTLSRAAFPTCPHHRFTGLTAPCHTQFLGQTECITLCVPGSSFTHKATNSGTNNITSVYYIVSYL
jgi:hypothetical protein